MADILDEISDDLRQQQLKQFWQENGNWIIGGAIFAVILTGAMTFWRGHMETVNERQTAELFTVLNAGTVEGLEKYAVENSSDHAMVARFMAASIENQRGESQKAAKIYNEIASMRGIETTYKDLARLLSATHSLETEKPEVLHKTLQDLGGKKNPWRFSAMELEALLYSREGKMKEAAGLLAQVVASHDAPEDVRARAMTLHSLYSGAAATDE